MKLLMATSGAASVQSARCVHSHERVVLGSSAGGNLWENLFEKQSVFPEFLSLLDEEGVKPMECVGTACETWLSLYLALQAHGDSTFLKSHDQAIRLKADHL
ncbi:hypothetical protein GQ600_4712 [Phytophthora cactorum]|nr:hypothetical protein GQ600_4712 [Phytophthora cactorum]